MDTIVLIPAYNPEPAMVTTAKELKEAGAANIYLYVTHCENTIYEGELLKEDSLIKHIFTTNSLLTAPNEKITIVE